MKKINLMEIINSNLTTTTIKEIIKNEAEMENKEVFEKYERQVDIEDIKEDIRLYAIRKLKELTDDIDEDLIEGYIMGMGNDEILKALE